MTTTTNTAEPPTDTTEASAETVEPDQQQADQPDANEPEETTPNREAAKWRAKLRAAEAERDAITERLTAYQRRECEAAVADLLDAPEDLFDIGQATVSDFYTEDGELDEAALRAAAGALCEIRPRLAKPAAPRWQNFGQGSQPPPAPKIGWNAVIGG